MTRPPPKPLTRWLAAGLCLALLAGTPVPALALRVGQENSDLGELKAALSQSGLEERPMTRPTTGFEKPMALTRWAHQLRGPRRRSLRGRVAAAEILHARDLLVPPAYAAAYRRLPSLGAQQVALAAAYLYRIGGMPNAVLRKTLDDLDRWERVARRRRGSHHLLALEIHSNIPERQARSRTIRRLLELFMRVPANIGRGGRLRVKTEFQDGGLEFQTLPSFSMKTQILLWELLEQVADAERFKLLGPSETDDGLDGIWVHINVSGQSWPSAERMLYPWVAQNAQLARLLHDRFGTAPARLRSEFSRYPPYYWHWNVRQPRPSKLGGWRTEITGILWGSARPELREILTAYRRQLLTAMDAVIWAERWWAPVALRARLASRYTVLKSRFLLREDALLDSLQQFYDQQAGGVPATIRSPAAGLEERQPLAEEEIRFFAGVASESSGWLAPYRTKPAIQRFGGRVWKRYDNQAAIPEMMRELVAWVNEPEPGPIAYQRYPLLDTAILNHEAWRWEWDETHTVDWRAPAVRAAMAHWLLTHIIHPFEDGNHRVGWAVMNHLRRQAGLPMLTEPTGEAAARAYYASFRLNDDVLPFLEFVRSRETGPSTSLGTGLEERPMTAAEAIVHAKAAGMNARQLVEPLLTLRELRAGQSSLHLGSGPSGLPAAEGFFGLNVDMLNLTTSGTASVKSLYDSYRRRVGIGGTMTASYADVRLWLPLQTKQWNHIVLIDLFTANDERWTAADLFFRELVRHIAPGGTILVSGRGRQLPEGGRVPVMISAASGLDRELKRQHVRFTKKHITSQLPRSVADTELWLFTLTPPAAGLEERPMTAAEAVAWWSERFGPIPMLPSEALPTAPPGRAIVVAQETDPSLVVLGLMGWRVTAVHSATGQSVGTLRALEELGVTAEVARRHGAVTHDYTPTALFRRHRDLGTLPEYILVPAFSEVNRWWPTPPDEKDAASSLVSEIVRTIAPGGTVVISGRDLAAALGSPDGAALLRKQLDRFATYQATELTTLESARILPLALWRFEIAPLQEQVRALVDRVGPWTGRDVVVVHPDVIRDPRYRGLAVLAELLPAMVTVDRGGETVEALRSSGVTHVNYYGESARAAALQRLTDLPVDAHPLSLELRLPVVVGRILANLTGKSETTVGRLVEIRPIARWLEQAA